jgi:hypothetical protein
MKSSKQVRNLPNSPNAPNSASTPSNPSPLRRQLNTTNPQIALLETSFGKNKKPNRVSSIVACLAPTLAPTLSRKSCLRIFCPCSLRRHRDALSLPHHMCRCKCGTWRACLASLTKKLRNGSRTSGYAALTLLCMPDYTLCCPAFHSLLPAHAVHSLLLVQAKKGK